MNQIQIQRFLNYLRALPYYEEEGQFRYYELRDAIRYALDVKMPYSESRKIIEELDKQGVIILHSIHRNGHKTYKINKQ